MTSPEGTLDIRLRPDLGCHALARIAAALATRRSGQPWDVSAFPEVDGSLSFLFESSLGTVHISWLEGIGKKLDNLPGCFAFGKVESKQTGLENELLHILGRTLSSSLSRPSFCALIPLENSEEGIQAEECISRITNWFEPERSGWHRYRIKQVLPGRNSVQLIFSDGQIKVSFDLRISDPRQTETHPKTHGESRLLLQRGFLSLYQNTDERSAQERETIEHQVERAVGFAIARILPKFEGQQTYSDEISPALASILQLGAVKQLDSYYFLPPETRWRQFMAVGEIESRHAFRWMDAPNVSLIQHADRACMSISPAIPKQEYSLYNLRSHEGQGNHLDHTSSTLATDIRGHDALLTGGEDVLRGLLLESANNANPERTYVIRKTCLFKLLGQNVNALLNEIKQDSKLEVFPFYPEDYFISPEASLRMLFEKLIDPAMPPKRNELPSVALIGLPAGPDTQELVHSLNNSGIEVSAQVIPNLEPAQLTGFHQAWLQVFPISNTFEENLKNLFESFENIPHIQPPAPFGIEATRLWCEAIAQALDLSDRWQAAYAKIEQDLQRQLQQWQQRSASITLAFVVEASQLRRIWEPLSNDGLSLLRVLREFGFSCRALVFEDASIPDFCPSLRELLATSKEETVDLSELQVECFSTQEELQHLLVQPEIGAVYSDYSHEERAFTVGKPTFSVRDFEMGFQGADRSFERLMQRCETPYYRRIADRIRKTHES